MGLEIINIIKKEKGMTSKQLSEKSKVPIGTLNKILNGQTKNPAYETIFALAKALDCSVDMFCDKKDTQISMSTLSKEETTLLENYNKLNSKGKEKLLDYSDDLTTNIKYMGNASDEISATKDNIIEFNTKDNKEDAEEVFVPYTSLDQAGTTIAAHDDDLTDEEKAEMDRIILEDINEERLREWNKKHNK